MGSSGQPDRSLGAGISLPQWMKNKMDARLDFDESAFSPPAYDDNFFYVRHSRNENPSTIQQGQFGSIGEKNNGDITATNQVTSGQQAVPDFKNIKQIDFSKHPLPCQPFVPSASDVKPPKLVVAGGRTRLKSQGTDDGFHGEPALCGKYIVHVANRLMSSKIRAVDDNDNDRIAKMGSKSLPATPLASPMTTPDSSPKARRKLHSNRYFTGSFVPDRDKYQGGWILASLLGQSREIVTTKIAEEEDDDDDENGLDAVPPKSSLNRKKSISSQNLTYIPKEDKSAIYAKPSELREMNFWSPTSM